MAWSVLLVHPEGSPGLTNQVADALVLDALPCDITRASAGRAVETALARTRVDLAICSLPGTVRNPAETIGQFRGAVPQVPTIAVLGHDNPKIEADVLHAGAVECLSTARLGRLGWAVRRAMAERERHARHEQVQANLESLEAQLRHAQKLTNLARLAGGIAHDFNNLLTVINGCSQLLLKTLPDDDMLRSMVEPIEQAGARGAELTKRLLAFSREEPAAATLVNVNQMIRDAEPMLATLAGETVRLSLNLDPSLWSVRADPGEFSQVLMNLVANARDAMADGGTVVIRTANVDLFSGGASPASGSFVELVVRDGGCGMSEDVRAKIFDPFFTTKPAGTGTGIGLATVRRIVGQAGGEIDVETAVGRGTTIRIRLPRADGAIARPAVSTVAADDAAVAARGTETVLVVEDEGGVRRILCGFLRGGGYRVVEAPDADAAVEICRRDDCAVDLLLSDVVLPGMSGPRLAETLQATLPGLKTLFVSGYPADALPRVGLSDSPSFLAKPFSREVLLQRVRKVLSE